MWVSAPTRGWSSEPSVAPLSLRGSTHLHMASLKGLVGATSILHASINPKHKHVHDADERGSCSTSTGLLKLAINLNKKTGLTSWRTISPSLLRTSASDMEVSTLDSQRGDTPAPKSPTNCPEQEGENKGWRSPTCATSKTRPEYRSQRYIQSIRNFTV